MVEITIANTLPYLIAEVFIVIVAALSIWRFWFFWRPKKEQSIIKARELNSK